MTKNLFNTSEGTPKDTPELPGKKRGGSKGKSKYRVTCRCNSVPCKRAYGVTLTTGERFLEGDYLPDNAPMNDIADLLAHHGKAIERED